MEVEGGWETAGWRGESEQDPAFVPSAFCRWPVSVKTPAPDSMDARSYWPATGEAFLMGASEVTRDPIRDAARVVRLELLRNGFLRGGFSANMDPGRTQTQPLQHRTGAVRPSWIFPRRLPVVFRLGRLRSGGCEWRVGGARA